MDQRTLLGRLLSPAGFGLVLLFFLLPFATVSCGYDQKFDSTFTGVDLVVGGPPTIAGPNVDAEVERELIALFSDQFKVDVFALLSVVAVLAAMAAGLIRERLARHGLSIGLAVLAGALLGGAILRAADRVAAALHSPALVQAGATGVSPEIPTAVEPRAGFWLAIGLLAMLGAGHSVALARAWSPPATPTPATDREGVGSSVAEHGTSHPIDGQAEPAPEP